MHSQTVPDKKNIEQNLPLFSSPIPAGFPSPADDYIEKQIDLNESLIKHPAATFYARVQGDSMINVGIMPGSIMVVDRAISAYHGAIIVATLDGEFTVKRMLKQKGGVVLAPENEKYKPMVISSDADFQVWGVVIHVIQSFHTRL